MLKVMNETTTTAELYIYGTIIDDAEGSWSTFWDENGDGWQWPSDLKRQLDGLKGKDLTIYINSDGGLISAGLAMAHMIERHDGKTTAIVDGFCCSIATQIFFAANRCVMSPNSYLMIHKPWCATCGDANEMRKAAEYLDVLQSGNETTYCKNALEGVTAEQIHAMVDDETWLTGTEATKIFQIELVDDRPAMNCIGSLERLKAIGAKKIPPSLNFIDEAKGIPTAPAKPSVPLQSAVDWSEVEIALARAKGVI